MDHRWQPRDVVPAVLAGVLLPFAAHMTQRFGSRWTGGPGWGQGPERLLDAGGIALVVVAGLALLWRRRSALVALAVVTAAITAYLWIGYPYGPPMLTVLVAVYSVAAHRPLRVSAIAAALAGLVLLSHLLARDPADLEPSSGIALAWFVVAFTIGVAVRTVRDSRARAREEALRQHLDSERLSLSRDVHDVVGHGLAAINMQAKVALRSVDRNDEHGRRRVRESLEAISASSAAALDELRAVLARIPTDGADAAPRRPAPGLADLPALTARLERTGLRVLVREEGEPAPLAPAADLAVYRVAQEALTNALRHGDASSAVEVAISHGPHALVLEVSNGVEHRATPHPVGGMGIPGMRDRVAAAGGTLDVDPGPPRFVVRARFPTKEGP
ncbi:sensor histidine kinase [Pseudactinotalea suaedae]|uniref:sensor histidine kinase n=1 Tax=Pseudactinotalea suaedae TaxID=1524924 RepID=UPI001391A632|nr:histidine kinase [Pseudactinotalea suaedae]